MSKKMIFKKGDKKMNITMSGKFPKARSEYEKAVHAHGGTMSSYVTEATDVLVSSREDVEAETMKPILAKGLEIPIVNQLWILESVKAGKLLDMDMFLIPTKFAKPDGKVGKHLDMDKYAIPTGKRKADDALPTPSRAKRAKPGPGWEYYAKKEGWCAFDLKSAEDAEDCFQKYKRSGGPATRLIPISFGWYEIDFANFRQTNVKNGKRRALRRVEVGETPGPEPPREIPDDVEPDPLWRAKVKAQEAEDA